MTYPFECHKRNCHLWACTIHLLFPGKILSIALLKKSEIQFRLWAMILTAVEAVFVKKVIVASSTTTAFMTWCYSGAFFSFVLLFIYKPDFLKEIKKTDRVDVYKYIFLVICIGIMQLTTNYAIEHMDVGYALSLFQLSTIISVFFGYRFFQEQDIRKKLVGSAIMIIGSAVIIVLRNN